ncbi:MAG: glutamine synthetase [Chloroflexi bacterium]|nr:glutamine synthetase [Chloroflexota bacterium]
MNERDQKAIDYVLHLAKEQDVRFIRLWFTDILGYLKGIAITVGELEDALIRGVGFDGSSVEGFARVDESDMVALPDASTFRILPWRPKQNAVARMFCDVSKPDGRPSEVDPRHVLKRNLELAAKLGYTYYVGPELEFFYFKDSESTQFIDNGGYFDQIPMDLATEMRRETVLTLTEIGIPIKYSLHEGAPSQYEINMQYTDALSMGDNVMTARLVIKEVALRHGTYASFMPKPVYGINGSGLHVNLSLFQGGRNAFYDPRDAMKLSSIAKKFLAGILRYAPEIAIVTNQWVNSYKRLLPGYEAPVYTSWALVNHSDMIRIPSFKTGREDSVRLEFRAPDPACNPYLAFAVILAAGLQGIEEELPLPAPTDENVFNMSEEERLARGINTLPGSLWEAILLAEKSDLLRKALGDQVFYSLLQNKKIEWDNYRRHVTDFEIKRYLPVL